MMLSTCIYNSSLYWIFVCCFTVALILVFPVDCVSRVDYAIRTVINVCFYLFVKSVSYESAWISSTHRVYHLKCLSNGIIHFDPMWITHLQSRSQSYAALTHSLTLSLLSMHRTDHTPWTVEYLSFSSGRWNDYLWNQLYIIGLYNLHNTFSFLFSLSFINNKGSEKTHVSCLWMREWTSKTSTRQQIFNITCFVPHTYTHISEWLEWWALRMRAPWAREQRSIGGLIRLTQVTILQTSPLINWFSLLIPVPQSV